MSRLQILPGLFLVLLPTPARMTRRSPLRRVHSCSPPRSAPLPTTAATRSHRQRFVVKNKEPAGRCRPAGLTATLLESLFSARGDGCFHDHARCHARDCAGASSSGTRCAKHTSAPRSDCSRQTRAGDRPPCRRNRTGAIRSGNSRDDDPQPERRLV